MSPDTTALWCRGFLEVPLPYPQDPLSRCDPRRVVGQGEEIGFARAGRVGKQSMPRCPLSGIDLSCDPEDQDKAREETRAKLRLALTQAPSGPLIADLAQRLRRKAAEDLNPPRSAPRRTHDAARLLRGIIQTVGESVGGGTRRTRRVAESQVKLPVHEEVILKLGTLVPHRNGLMDIPGRAVQWDRIKNPQWGLLPAMKALGLHVLGLPGVRVWEDFDLPASLGFRFETWGGVSYHSVGLVTPIGPGLVEDCQVVYDLSSPMAAVVLIADIVVVWFALPTPGGPAVDALWVTSLREGAAAGAKAAERFRTKRVPWLGDFNYQPPEVGPPLDPHGTRRTNWEALTKEFGMKVLNPRRTWSGVGNEDDRRGVAALHGVR